MAVPLPLSKAPAQTGVARGNVEYPTFTNCEWSGDPQITHGDADSEDYLTGGQTSTTENWNYRTTVSGTLLLAAAFKNVPMKGDVIKAKNTTPSKWLDAFLEVTDAPTVAGKISGRVSGVDVTLTYWPGKQSAWGNVAPTDIDAVTGGS